jgi:hypothetical protein
MREPDTGARALGLVGHVDHLCAPVLADVRQLWSGTKATATAHAQP